MQVKRTYGSRSNTTSSSSLLRKTTTQESPTCSTVKQKRPLADSLYDNVPTPLKRQKLSSSKAKAKAKTTPLKQKQKKLTQLHFAIDQSILRTCPLCDLSYTKGAPEDESLHRAHCARVRRGMEWGREEERESAKVGVIEIASQVKIATGERGRIISCPAECTGKTGSKISALLQTINLSLSSPPLTQECLRNSKIYMFLLPQTPTTSNSGSGREKIAGCTVVQRISTAMAIASPDEVAKINGNSGGDSDDAKGGDSNGDGDENPEQRLVAVDSGTGLFCRPDPLPTHMGIPRLFVPSTYRRQGIASELLNAAAATFVHGCPLDPKRGEVAFTQPTGDGKALMTKWGSGAARIYEE
ncbi:hypothetical protein P691DRAFT_659101 [Macrolepiota fuliginosa MF-IS2]|uniref:N-acetyltransferase ECO1 n=1 Tax=Macrolepiota fuliginosa MF-IS2 TaxID=1400762 RepID=A0A9P6C666_9AGAR|nr:hypothetical protein P691DRAFT_659101 [Macrolepiota fuliginosa MF-IS2]